MCEPDELEMTIANYGVEAKVADDHWDPWHTVLDCETHDEAIHVASTISALAIPTRVCSYDDDDAIIAYYIGGEMHETIPDFLAQVYP